MKGKDPRDEMARASGYRCKPIRLNVPFLDGERHLLLCEPI
jgi:hypothetical protein